MSNKIILHLTCLKSIVHLFETFLAVPEEPLNIHFLMRIVGGGGGGGICRGKGVSFMCYPTL